MYSDDNGIVVRNSQHGWTRRFHVLFLIPKRYPRFSEWCCIPATEGHSKEELAENAKAILEPADRFGIALSFRGRDDRAAQ